MLASASIRFIYEFLADGIAGWGSFGGTNITLAFRKIASALVFMTDGVLAK